MGTRYFLVLGRRMLGFLIYGGVVGEMDGTRGGMGVLGTGDKVEVVDDSVI